MKQDNKSILKIVINLTGACIISGIIIAVVYYCTAQIAEQKNIQMTKSAMKDLVIGADNFEPMDNKNGWFKAIKDRKIIAYIVPSESHGYGGTMKLLVAVTTDAKVLNFNALENRETPGLGDKAFKRHFTSQFINKPIENLKITKDTKNKNDIQAISGATISSTAVTNGVREAVKKVQEYLKEGK